MTTAPGEECPDCGGIHYGQNYCPTGNSPAAVKDRERKVKRQAARDEAARLRPYPVDGEGSVVEELWNGAEWVDSGQRTVGFACALVGGHELRVTIPGIGAVDDADALPLWREMADRLAQIAKSFGKAADVMERAQQERLD